MHLIGWYLTGDSPGEIWGRGESEPGHRPRRSKELEADDAHPGSEHRIITRASK